MITFPLLPGKKIGSIESFIRHELRLLVQWLLSNKLPLSKAKTELIISRSPWKHLSRKADIRVNNYNLKSSHQIQRYTY